MSVKGEVNPNGAATTYKYEYGTNNFQFSTSAVSAGSGTSFIPVAKVLDGLYPNAPYQWRLSATNSFGTTTGAQYGPTTWRWLFLGSAEETIASHGTLTVVWPDFGGTPTLKCKESGTGRVNSVGGLKDEYNATFSGCELFSDNELKASCHWPEFKLHVGGKFMTTAETAFTWILPEPCDFLSPETKVILPTIHSNFWSIWGVTWAAETKFGAQPATFSSTTEWEYTGAHKGEVPHLG